MSKQDGQVVIDLDKRRKLKFGLNAMASFEEVMDMSLPYLLQKVGQVVGDPDDKDNYHPERAVEVIGLRHIRAMLWAALLHEEPTLTIHEAGDLVEQAKGDGVMQKMLYVQDKVMEAFNAMQNPESKNESAAAQKNSPESGTGQPSKRSPTATSA